MEEGKHMSLEEEAESLEAALEASAETISPEARERMRLRLEGIDALLTGKAIPSSDDQADQSGEDSSLE